MARRRYRYTWDNVPYIHSDCMAKWGAFKGYSGPLECEQNLTAHMEHDTDKDVASIFYAGKDGGPVRANVHLIRCAQGYGNRTYFRAPCCNRQVRLLALLPQGVACAECGSITQPTQRRGKTQRLIWRASKLAYKLDCDNWFSEPKARPKHMRRETFMRLAEEHARAANEAMAVIAPRLQRAAFRGTAAYFAALVRASM